MSKIITTYNKFLQEVDYVKGVEGDGEFDNTVFKKLNEDKGVQVNTRVPKDIRFSVHSLETYQVSRLWDPLPSLCSRVLLLLEVSALLPGIRRFGRRIRTQDHRDF